MARLADRVTDGDVAVGLRLATMPMNVSTVVTIVGSMYGGEIFSLAQNIALAELTAGMLDKGTNRRDKFEISGLLESVGAQIGFSSDDYRVNFSARCLKDDVPLVVELLAEQLREPAFREADLATLQQRVIGNLKRQSENTDFCARMKFSQLVYPPTHPNYIPPLDKQIADIEGLSPADLESFHNRHYGRGNMIIVAAGDLDRMILEDNLASHLAEWQMIDLEPPSLDKRRAHRDQSAREEIVTMVDKTSVDLILGLALGIDREHPEYLPLNMGTYILGGNFSARLMAKVRDEAGLTYGIGASIGGASDGKDGFWFLNGTFAPSLLKQGKAAALAQLEQWVNRGVSEDELIVKKTTITGIYKVGLATTSGIAAILLDILERGKDSSYLDDYIEEVNEITFAEVNTVISKYIQLEHLQAVAAGSVDKNWAPLDMA
jgi:zinc protease